MKTVAIEHLPALRWDILRTLDVGGRLGATDVMLHNVISAAYLTATRETVRDELQYLEDRQLVTVERSEVEPWRAVLTRHGRDVVEYQVECHAGIKRPPRLGA